MATDKIKQTQQNLDNLAKSTSTFASIFNGASNKVVGDIDVMGMKFNDLKDKINELKATSNTLKNQFNVAISKGNVKFTESMQDEIVDLSNTFEKLTPVIIAHIDALNNKFKSAFNSNIQESTKDQLNDIAKEFNRVSGQIEKDRPDLTNFAKEFVHEVDVIEEAMGELTRYGKNRSELDLSLGFKLTKGDISGEIDTLATNISRYERLIASFTDPTELLNIDVIKPNKIYRAGFDEEGRPKEWYENDVDKREVNLDTAKEELQNLEKTLKQLESRVGSEIKGYISIFNKADALLSAGQNKRLLINELNSDGSNTDAFMTRDELVKSTPEELNNKLYDINTEKQVSDTRELGEILNNIISTQSTLSKQQIEEALNEEAITRNIKERETHIANLQRNIKGIANTDLDYMQDIKLDITNPTQLKQLLDYKSIIDDTLSKVKNLKKEQETDVKNLNTKSNLLDNEELDSFIERILSVKHTLENGMRVNIEPSSDSFNKLNEIENIFKYIVKNYKNFKLPKLSSDDLSDLAKIKILTSKITSEKQKQADAEEALNNYEKNTVKYLELQKQYAIANNNLEAYKYLKTKDKDSDTDYSTLIGNEKNNIKSIANKISEMQSIFSKYNLKIPVVPDMSNLGNTIKSNLNDIYNKFKSADAETEAINKEKEAIKNLINETRNYVSTQEAIRGNKMPIAEQVQYYTQQLGKFKQGTKEYIEVLKLLRNAEKQTQQESSNRIKTIGSTITKVGSVINNAVNKIINIIRTGMNIIKTVINGTIKVIRGIGNVITKIVSLFGSFGNRIRSFFGIATKGAGETTRGFNVLKGTATELYSKLRILQMAINGIFNNQYVQKAKQLYGSVFALKNIMGGSLTADTIAWANKMEYTFGLSARQLINDLSELSGVLYGLGMTGENTQTAAKNILMVGKYLAFMGYSGGDVNVVIDKLISGMKGMTQSVDDLGISVRESQMDNFLKNLKAQGGEYNKLGTSFSSLNEEARVYIRYASIIDQFTSKYNINNFANALDTVSGRISVLKEQTNNLGIVIGQVFTKLLSAAAPYIIYFISIISNAVSRLSQFISMITGINLDTTLSASMSDGASAVDNLNNGLSDTKNKLDDVKEAAESAKGSLISGDRITSISASGSSGSGNDAFDYSKLMSDALGGLNEIADKAQKSYIERMKENWDKGIKDLRDKFNNFAKDITGHSNFSLGFDTKKIKSDLDLAWGYIKVTLGNIGSTISNIGLSIADDFKIGRIITDVVALTTSILGLTGSITGYLKPQLKDIYEKYFSGLTKLLGDKLHTAIVNITNTVREMSEVFRILGSDSKSLEELAFVEKFKEEHPILAAFVSELQKMLDTLRELGEYLKALSGDNTIDNAITIEKFKQNHPVLYQLVETLREVLGLIESVKKGFTGLFTGENEGGSETGSNAQMLKKAGEGALAGYVLGGQKGAVAGGIAGFIFGAIGPEKTAELIAAVTETLKSLGIVLGPLIESFAEWAKEELLPWLIEKLKAIGDWITENKDEIKKFFETFGNEAWNDFKIFVDTLGKLIDYIIKNPDTVIGFLKTLLALKIGSWFLEGSGSIMQWVGSFSKFLDVLGGGGLSKILAGGGLSKILAVAVPAAMGALGLTMGGIDAYQAVNKSTDWFGEEEGNTTSAKVSSAIGGFIGGDHGGIMDETMSAGEKAKEVGLNALKGAAIGGAIGSIVPGIGTAIGAAVGGVVGAISGAIGGENIAKALNFVWEKIKDGAKTAWDQACTDFKDLTNVLSENATYFKDNAIQAWDDIKTGAATAWDTVSSSFATATDKISEFATNTKDKAVEAWNGIKEGASTAWNNVKDTVQNTSNNISESANGLKNNIINTWDNIKSSAAEKWENIKSSVSTAYNNITTNTDNLKNTLGEKFTQVSDNIKNAFNNLPNTLGNTFTGIKDNAINIFNSLKDSVSNTIDNIGGLVNTGISKVKNFASNAWNSVKDTASNIWDGIKNFGSTAYSGISDAGKDVFNRVSNFKIPGFASGGTPQSGQLFVAREDGLTEYVGNFGGRSGVANNEMITQAIKNAVEEAVRNGMIDVVNESRRYSKSSNNNAPIQINGFGLIDENTLRKLASLLASVSKSNNINIADTAFTLR